ncbi:MAG: site-specific integrase [Alphaproteobacteria bacterium]|nr:site-specific integrase [Alphaproteobacteria bacterium]
MQPGSDLLDETIGPRFAPITIKDLERRYARFLGYAKSTGRLCGDQNAAATITRPLVDEYIRYLSARVGSINLAGTLRKIHRCATLLEPDRDWTWLSRLASRFERFAKPKSKADTVADPRSLIRLGLSLMREVEHKTDPTVEEAEAFRDGLMISLLTMTALRIGAFVELEIGTNLNFTGSAWHIHLPARPNSKHRTPIDIPLMPSLNRFIVPWLQIFRYSFVEATKSQRLWLSRLGTMTQSQAYDMIVKRTRRAIGRAINPHLIRRSAATMIASDVELEPELARAVLGHKDYSTTSKHYTHLTTDAAIMAYQRKIGLRST